MTALVLGLGLVAGAVTLGVLGHRRRSPWLERAGWVVLWLAGLVLASIVFTARQG